MARLGPYSAPTTLAKLDRRTREAKLMRETRAELTAHLGGAPSATQSRLIEQVVQLTLRTALMDREFAQTGHMNDHQTRSYLAWAGATARLLRHLGLQAAPPPRLSLQDHIAARTAARA